MVGVLVLGATTGGGAPRTLALSLAHNSVQFAATQTEAVAMTSTPVATKVASRAVAPRRTATRVGVSIPAGHMSIGVASVASAVTAPSTGGNDLVRALRANSRDVAAATAPVDAPRVASTDVERSPPSDVLLAARPQRGPPVS